MASTSCSLCEVDLSNKKTKIFCKDCKKMVCTSCNSLKNKLLYMRNDDNSFQPGQCFTCDILMEIKKSDKDFFKQSVSKQTWSLKNLQEKDDTADQKAYPSSEVKLTHNHGYNSGGDNADDVKVMSEYEQIKRTSTVQFVRENSKNNVDSHPVYGDNSSISDSETKHLPKIRINRLGSSQVKGQGHFSEDENKNENEPYKEKLREKPVEESVANSEINQLPKITINRLGSSKCKGQGHLMQNEKNDKQENDYDQLGENPTKLVHLAEDVLKGNEHEGEGHPEILTEKVKVTDTRLHVTEQDYGGENANQNSFSGQFENAISSDTGVEFYKRTEERNYEDSNGYITNYFKTVHSFHGDDYYGNIEEESTDYDHLNIFTDPENEQRTQDNYEHSTKTYPGVQGNQSANAHHVIVEQVNSTDTGNLKEKGSPTDKVDFSSDDSKYREQTVGTVKPLVKQEQKQKSRKKSAKEHLLREGMFSHTCAGCGRKDCEGNFMRLLKEMISTAKAVGFEIHNVTPDGNCMFAAAVDQLEYRNDRKFSPRGLRQACVDFLRDNPYSDDGTPYALFLDNESWEDYLSRMSQEGQWGDHMVLQAIAQVTQQNIQVIHNEDQRDWTVIETKIPNTDNSDPIFLGHVGEFHYVSLRPSDRTKKGYKEDGLEDEDFRSLENFPSLTLPSLHDARRDMFEEDYVDSWSEVPALHLSYLIKKLFPQSIIKMADQMMQTGISMELQRQEDVRQKDERGFLNQQTMAYTVSITAMGDVVEGLFVPYINERERTQYDSGSEWTDVKMLMTLEAFKAYPRGHSTMTEMDTIIESENVHPGYARLLANYPDMWGMSEFPGDSTMTYYVPNNHSYFESASATREEKDSRASQIGPIVSLFVDFSNAIACPLWPNEAMEWKTRYRPAEWPSEGVIESIVVDGCHLEGKPHVNSTNPDIEFCFCFGQAERFLATQALTKEQRLCFLLFKSLCSQEFRGQEVVTSSHLKSLFFYACERLNLECWSTKMGSCLLFLIDFLMRSVQERDLPNYFIPTNNMFDHLNDDQFHLLNQQIMNLRTQPLVHLVTIAHQNGILNATDILSKVQDDFQEFCEHRSVRRSVLGSFVPMTIQIAQEYIQDQFYIDALELVQEAYEERLNVSTCEDQLPFTAFISEVINKFPLKNQYWFLFSVDEKLGTTLCAELSMRMTPVTMQEIFPENICRHHQGVLIPQTMVENLCIFCIDFSTHLTLKNRTYQAIDVLEFAIQKYHEKQERTKSLGGLQEFQYGAMATMSSTEDFCDADVCSLYGTYLVACKKMDKMDLFRAKMDDVEVLCKRVNSRESYLQLSVAWKMLGEEEKSQIALNIAQTLPKSDAYHVNRPYLSCF